MGEPEERDPHEAGMRVIRRTDPRRHPPSRSGSRPDSGSRSPARSCSAPQTSGRSSATPVPAHGAGSRAGRGSRCDGRRTSRRGHEGREGDERVDALEAALSEARDERLADRRMGEQRRGCHRRRASRARPVGWGPWSGGCARSRPAERRYRDSMTQTPSKRPIASPSRPDRRTPPGRSARDVARGRTDPRPRWRLPLRPLLSDLRRLGGPCFEVGLRSPISPAGRSACASA